MINGRRRKIHCTFTINIYHLRSLQQSKHRLLQATSYIRLSTLSLPTTHPKVRSSQFGRMEEFYLIILYNFLSHTQIMYPFNRRTVEPFLAAAPGGQGNSTSRWQTFGLIRSLAEYYTVIPVVAQLIITGNLIYNLWFTKTRLRACSNYHSHSQADLSFYSINVISNYLQSTSCKPSLHFRRPTPHRKCLRSAFTI